MTTSGWHHLVDRLRGSTVRFDLSPYRAPLADIAALEESVRQLTDAQITEASLTLRRRVAAGEPLIAVRAMLFALAREAARRAIGQRPFDEQIVAGLALDDGHVVEMQTGEGKTLAAVAPAALNALSGRGVHVLTFNDYLAQRDAEWMGPVFRRLGLAAASVQQGMSRERRRDAYRADVTYVTAKEAGFDHLRDNLARDPADVVHRECHVALVDEADSLLIDEGRAPLVIAGRVALDASLATRLAALVPTLIQGTEFEVDEYERNVELTDAGIEAVERALACGHLHDERNIPLLTEVNCALHARVLLRRDVDYIVRDGRIEMVDEHTGRVVQDRHWPDGLQAAIEAKEGIVPRADGRILGSLTLQRFLRGYSTLCGMTGTARDAAEELRETYGLDVLVVPTHRPVARIDRDDVVFTHREAKERRVVDEVRRAHAIGRPVLVGTSTVTESERLADRIRDTGIVCHVLNAKNDAEEAALVAKAGALGAVTIATNMAGRGTDIRLGGDRASDHARVAALGGLYVIGTNRHESRRVDRQLAGRAGRQGDPGESRFFVSLEDDLLVRYRTRGLIPARFLPPPSATPIEIPVIRREIGRTQRIVEGQHFEIRRTLGRYAHVVEQQYALLLERRRDILHDRAITSAERLMALACIDRVWCEHLAYCAELREGIHLVRLGGADPLTSFATAAIHHFSQLDDAIDAAVLEGSGLEAPASTWTYLVNDDPFKNTIGALLAGPGGVTLAIYTAVVMPLLLLAWAAVQRLQRWRGRRT